MSPSVRTRNTRAGSVDDQRNDTLRTLELPGSNNGTPVKTRTRRASVQPSEPSVIEEPRIITRGSRRRIVNDPDSNGV